MEDDRESIGFLVVSPCSATMELWRVLLHRSPQESQTLQESQRRRIVGLRQKRKAATGRFSHPRKRSIYWDSFTI